MSVAIHHSVHKPLEVLIDGPVTLMVVADSHGTLSHRAVIPAAVHAMAMRLAAHTSFTTVTGALVLNEPG